MEIGRLSKYWKIYGMVMEVLKLRARIGHAVSKTRIHPVRINFVLTEICNGFGCLLDAEAHPVMHVRFRQQGNGDASV